MTRIVTTTYRYKPPPKRKGRTLAKITGPAVVTAKGSRRPGRLRGGEQAAAEVNQVARRRGGRRSGQHTARKSVNARERRYPRRSAIVTVPGRKKVQRQRTHTTALSRVKGQSNQFNSSL